MSGRLRDLVSTAIICAFVPLALGACTVKTQDIAPKGSMPARAEAAPANSDGQEGEDAGDQEGDADLPPLEGEGEGPAEGEGIAVEGEGTTGEGEGVTEGEGAEGEGAPDGGERCEFTGCTAGFLCNPGGYCVPVPVDGGVPDAADDGGADAEVDAGPDAGDDGGVDAEVDAGADAGDDAGSDAGDDAGTDAGTDAGPTCFDEGHACADTRDCCAPLLCDGFCMPPCTRDADCGGNQVCNLNTGLCESPAGCTGDSQCAPEEMCSGGRCVPRPPSNTVETCLIISQSGAIHQGQQVTLHAMAYNAQNDPVAGQVFEWMSSVPARAYFQTPNSTGVLTGAASPGQTSITAQVQGGVACANPITYENFVDPPPGTIRVVVKNAATGASIFGARVLVVIGANRVEATTNASGVAELAGNPPLDSVSVFHADYTYLTLIGGTDNDYYVTLEPNPGNPGGIEGHFDFTQVTTSGTVYMGLAVLSLKEELLNFDLERLMGPAVMTPFVTVTQSGEVPVPEAMEFRTSGLITINKDSYRARSWSGLHAAAGLGGRFSQSILLQLFQDLYGSGTPSTGQLLAAVMRLINLLSDHAVNPATAIDAGTFDPLNLPLEQPLSINTVVNVPVLPQLGSAYLDTAVAHSGTLAPETGLVMLGMSAGSDDENPVTRDGRLNPPANSGLQPGQLLVKSAPLHGGLEGSQYAMMILAQPVIDDSLFPPNTNAVIVQRMDTLPGTLSPPQGFIGFPSASNYTRASGLVAVPVVSGAEMIRLYFVQNGQRWIVLASNSGAGFTVPAPPSGITDRRGGEVNIQAVDLADGVAYQELIGFAGREISELAYLVDRYSTLGCEQTAAADGCDID